MKYIDEVDPSSSTSRLLAWEALRKYPTKALINLLDDPEIEVRTLAARELQLRGGRNLLNLGAEMLASRSPARRALGAFLLGQLGAPRLPFATKTGELFERLLAREKSRDVVEVALYALGHVGGKEKLTNGKLRELVKARSQSSNSGMRRAARFALRSFEKR
jgi:HEAT repeat protein